jgi:hypothetical protein
LTTPTSIPRTSTTHSTPRPARPSIAVTPRSGLHDLQNVLVTGVNFPKNSTVLVRECLVDLSDCAGQLIPSTHQTDAAGVFGARLTVHASVAGTRCGAGNCMIVVTSVGTTSAHEADATISFG